MAYAGNISIKVNLEDKEFNKQLTSLNNSIKKIKVDIFRKMQQEINSAVKSSNDLVNNIKSFNQTKVNTNSFRNLEKNLAGTKGYLDSVNKILIQFSSNVNNVKGNGFKDIASGLRSISNLDMSKVDLSNVGPSFTILARSINSINMTTLKYLSSVLRDLRATNLSNISNINNINSNPKITKAQTKAIVNAYKRAEEINKKMEEQDKRRAEVIEKAYKRAESINKSIAEQQAEAEQKRQEIIQRAYARAEEQNKINDQNGAKKGEIDTSQFTGVAAMVAKVSPKVAAIIAIIGKVMETVQKVAGKIKKVINAIITPIKKLIGFIGKIGKAALQVGIDFSKAFKDKVIEVFQNTASKIKESVSSVISSVRNLYTGFKSIMYSLGVDLSFRGFVNSVRTATSEMIDLKTATLGFNSMIRAQGFDLDKAKDYLEAYADDGLVSMQSAMTQYKNYALKGYTQSEIEEVMRIVKDFAIVNRKSGVALETALDNLSEGVKLDMSRLMDASGLSKNLSDMYSDYAKKIGVATSEVKENNKLQIEAQLDYFRQMNKYAEGNAVRLAETFVGTTSRIKVQMKYLFAEIGNTAGFILKPILNEITNIFVSWKEKVKDFNNYINDTIVAGVNSGAELFGVSLEKVNERLNEKLRKNAQETNSEAKQVKAELEGIEDITEGGNLAGGTEALTDSLEEAADAAEKVLAPFDTINQLKFGNVSEIEEADSAAGLEESKTEEEVKERVFWLDFLKVAIEEFIDSLKLDTERIGNAWDKLMKTLYLPTREQFKNDFVEYLNDTMDKIGKKIEDFKPVIKFTVEQAVPTAIESVDGVIQEIQKAFETADYTKLNKNLKDFWNVFWGNQGEKFSKRIIKFVEDFITPFIHWVIEWVLPTAMKLLTKLFELWDEYGDDISRIIQTIWKNLQNAFSKIDFGPLNKSLKNFWNTLWGDNGEKFSKRITDFFNNYVTPFLEWAIEWALPNIIDLIESAIEFWDENNKDISNTIQTAWYIIQPLIEGFIEKIKYLFENWDTLKVKIGDALNIGVDFFQAMIAPLPGGTFLAMLIELVQDAINGFFGLTKDAETAEYKIKRFFYSIYVQVDELKTYLSNFDFWDYLLGKGPGMNPEKDLELLKSAKKNMDSRMEKFDKAWDLSKDTKYDVNNVLKALNAGYDLTPKYATGTYTPVKQGFLDSTASIKQASENVNQNNMLDNMMNSYYNSNQRIPLILNNVLKVDGQVLYNSNNTISRQRGTLMINR